MNWSEMLKMSLLLLLPLAMVLLFVYCMLKSFFKQFDNTRKQEFRLKTSRQVVTLRLQAYERLTLLLERIKPESMILRVDMYGMSALELQRVLLQNIRDEFEHNLSQQIYVSGAAWAMVDAARQSMLQLVSSAANDLEASASASELANNILEEFSSISDDPLTVAIAFVGKEVKEMLL